MRGWKDYERDVAKRLGTWWGCIFRRTPSSGAWGKQGQSRFSKVRSEDAAGEFHGDIVAPAEACFPFSVECKCYKEVELYKALYGVSNIYEWWAQCVRDTPKGMYPMLVMKEDRKKPLVAISSKCFDKLKDILPITTPVMTLGTGAVIYIMDFETFLTGTPAKQAKAALSNAKK
jgi:hypothetical protein